MSGQNIYQSIIDALEQASWPNGWPKVGEELQNDHAPVTAPHWYDVRQAQIAAADVRARHPEMQVRRLT